MTRVDDSRSRELTELAMLFARGYLRLIAPGPRPPELAALEAGSPNCLDVLSATEDELAPEGHP